MPQTLSSKRFDDDVVIVTGSTRGIGRGIAKRFAEEGATVIVTGRSTDEGERVASCLNDVSEAEYIPADMRSPSDIDELIQTTIHHFDTIDILINNAGVETETSVKNATIEDWNRIVETDFRSFWLCASKAAEYLSSGNCIVNMSSNHSFLTMPNMFPYNAVKSGIDGMTRAMALDFGPEVRVNTVNPGWIAIDRTVSELTEEERAHLERIHPIGRMGTPEDVAGAVTFLASDDAQFITGANLRVDGGRSAVLQDDTLPDYSSR